MIVRNRLAVSLCALALLATAPLAAQKPGTDEAPDPARELYRGQGIALCVAELRSTQSVTPDDLEAICGCAFDLFLSGRATESLPPLSPARIHSTLNAPILSCAADRSPRLAGAIGQRLTQMAAAPPVEFEAQPVPGKPAAAPGFSLQRWWAGLSAPSWLGGSGIPAWGWIILLLCGFLLLRALFRRRDGRGHLTGPPAHMRPTGRAPHLPPRG
jgi:hypothetical protein